MYVQRLIEFAENNPDKLPAVGYQNKKIQWVVDIEELGLTISPLKNLQLTVPNVGRSSNIRPILLADKPDYVFGFYEKEKDRKRAEERHQSFLDLLETYVDETEDKAVKLLLYHLNKTSEMDENFKVGDFIVFRINDEEFLHEKQSVIDFWRRYVNPDSGKESSFSCMFCHKNRPVLKRHSINFLIGPDRTKMISANENAYESYGLKNSEIAPTCFECEQKYGKALEYLLAKYKDRQLRGGPHMFQLGEMIYVYWVRDGEQLDGPISYFVSPSDEQTADDMRDLLEQTFHGQLTKRDVNNFCVMSLSANKARLVVRDYVEDSAGEIKRRIANFFEAQDVGQQHFYGIYTLAATMYSKPSNQMQKYAIKEWMDWFLHGYPLSGRVLIPILRRIQAIGIMYPQYGAAVQSWLVSQRKGWDLEMKEKNETDAYVTGRVFAVLERIQYAATNKDGMITSKFFGSASTTPRSVMGMLIRNSQHYLAKLSSDKESYANYLKNELGNILSKLDTFPTTLDLKSQAEFALGYYHQRQQYFTSKTKVEMGD